jgi:site-specific DNA-methyltransferase (adenine-specific)
MFNKKLLLSSGKTDWKTPRRLYQELDKIFKFDFDPCPPNPRFDGLNIAWKSSNYVNPPYGTVLDKWLRKSFEESQKGKVVVVLIPGRTDTRWWHDFVMKANEIWFIKGRLKFDDQENSAPFPSVIIIFKRRRAGAAFPIIKSVDTLARAL